MHTVALLLFLAFFVTMLFAEPQSTPEHAQMPRNRSYRQPYTRGGIRRQMLRNAAPLTPGERVFWKTVFGLGVMLRILG
jgi:hypothetical protein